jgi:hypothetical protein
MLRPINNKRLGLAQGAFRSHVRSVNQRVQKVRGSRLVVPYLAKLMLFTCVAPRTKSKGLPIGGPLFS